MSFKPLPRISFKICHLVPKAHKGRQVPMAPRARRAAVQLVPKVLRELMGRRGLPVPMGQADLRVVTVHRGHLVQTDLKDPKVRQARFQVLKDLKELKEWGQRVHRVPQARKAKLVPRDPKDHKEHRAT